MFCPNCGTENDAQAAACKKCGFNLKGAAAPKFKGTMLMVNAPPSVPRVAPTPGPGAVAPIGGAVSPAPRPRLKGTMLGVAPPPPGGIAPPPPLEPAPHAHQAPAPAPPAAEQLPGPPHAASGARSPSVNPLGGTMLAGDGGAPQAFQSMGAMPPAGAGAPPAGGAPAWAPPAPPAAAFPGAGNPPGFPDAGGMPAPPPAYGTPGLPPQAPMAPEAQPAQPYQNYPGQGAPYAPPGQEPAAPGYGASPGYGTPPDAQQYAPPQPGQGAPPGFGAPPGAPPGVAYAQPGMQSGYGGPGYGPPAQEAQPGAYGQWGQPMPQAAGMMPYQGGPVATPGMHGPVGTIRNPIVVLVLCCVTCGIYPLFWVWTSISELKAFRQKDDLNPILFFIPILSILETWKLPPKVLEAKQLAGVANAQVPHPVFYLLLSPYFLTVDLNEAYAAAQARQQRGG